VDRYEASITLDLPPEEVFAFVSDPTNETLWRTDPVAKTRIEIEPINGPPWRLNSSFHRTEHVRWEGFKQEADVWIIEYDPPRRIALSKGTGAPKTEAFEVESARTGSRLTRVYEIDGKAQYAGRVGRAAAAILRRFGQDHMRTDAERELARIRDALGRVAT
jgi:uncharacterized protein YndB with AHSA1/START domain